MDISFAESIGLPLHPIARTQEVQAIDGHIIYQATHETDPITMRLGGNHVETLSFLAIPSPNISVILGITWLRTHNPQLDWLKGEILGWSDKCMFQCLTNASPSLLRTPDSSETYPDLSKVPIEYHNLKEAFNKHRATRLPPHRLYDCAIDLLPGTSPPRGRLFSLSLTEQEAMRKYIHESLQSGIIRPSSSPAGAGFFFVGKKDGSLRPCIDYRGLNNITVKNHYPLPLINSAFDSLRGSQVFTKLDLRNAYHLVRIREGDEWKTAFNTPNGHYEYLVMPFGLTNAPAVFQALVNDVLRDMVGRFVFVYLDDVLVFSPDLDTHRRHVRAVILRLLQNNLFIKAEKCEFHKASMSFLGFILSPNQISMDPTKVTAVVDWPPPTDRKQLQRFLGFANFYRRFIKGYSRIAAPLHALTSNKVSYVWTDYANRAFLKLKELFTTAPVLHSPDPARQFIVEVDASAVGVGAVLSQRSSDNKVHPCAFFSKTLSPAERNYDVGDRELLAVKLALEEWRHWLEGAITPFLVWTDHKNLEYLQTAKRLNPRQARWALFFSRFNFHLSYRPGTKNTKPDALSRIMEHQVPEPNASTDSTVLPKGVLLGVSRLALENKLKETEHLYPAPPQCPPGRIYVPDHLRTEVLLFCHSSRLFCHPGITRTINVVRSRFWWPALAKDSREFVRACPDCAKAKASRRPPAGLLRPLPVPHRPWSHLSMDFVTGLPPSNSFRVILTVVDRFSKMVHLVPLKKLPTASDMADILAREVFRLHGLPQDIVSDRGPQFVSRFWKAFCARLGIQVSLSSGFHPQTDGQTERHNQEMETKLRLLCQDDATTWSQNLPWVEHAMNSLPTTATGVSPFFTVFGYQPPVFSIQETLAHVPSAYAAALRCRRAWWSARRRLLQASAVYARSANRRRIPAPAYRVGQKVWLSTADIPLRVDCRKLAPRFIGPFPISKVINPAAVRLRLPRALRVHPSFHVSKVKPVVSSSLVPSSGPPPPARLLPGGPVWAVRRVLRSQRRGRGLQYLVDWAGFGPEERSWVPARRFVDLSLLRDSRRSRPGRPGGPSGAGPCGGDSVMPPLQPGPVSPATTTSSSST
uniref:Gypsy retrotransposon integrase-like protein 1 n=1 Tax=Nothobranchius furzeri TaxID=105023 RepID=A0A8C6NKF8_NOTFU